MGCAGSKKAGADAVAVADVVYRPPPTSVSLFDISAVEEPWLIATKTKVTGDDGGHSSEEEETDDDDSEEEEEEEEKPAGGGKPLLEKLVEGYELAPASWSEVSKALEDMKPVLADDAAAAAPAPKKKKIKNKNKKAKKTKKKQQQPQQQAEQKPLLPAPSSAAASTDEDSNKPPPPELVGRRVVKDNPFLMRDRESNKQQQGGPTTKWKRRDPFEGCPERRPPGATGGGVVLYTTTLHGVRRTFEDCERTRDLVQACAEAAGVPAVDERDVSLHADYLRELRDLLLSDEGAGASSWAPPRLFVMGRYVGGADECAKLADSGKLAEMMRWAKARGEACCAAKDGRGCEGCGGARFVPCWECGGSCKLVVDGADGEVVQRCAKCNENGLMMCPICH